VLFRRSQRATIGVATEVDRERRRQIAGCLAVSLVPSPTINLQSRRRVRLAIVALATLIVVAAMAFDTKIVKIGSPADTQPGAFSAAAFGAAEFPKVQAAIESRAVDAAKLASAVAKDKEAAAKEYGVEAGTGAEMSVKFTGVVGKGESGVYAVQVSDVPSTLTVRVQTGPAINGTDLRDATGTIAFGQFVNQIDYQNAGSALNKEMKKQVLSKVDASALSGKTISVVGAFKLINPNSWLVTPVKLDVQ
jgi:predicted lipoprotein